MPTGINNVHAAGACAEGAATVPRGSVCTARCAAGYAPSVASLACDANGTLSASTFTCAEDTAPAAVAPVAASTFNSTVTVGLADYVPALSQAYQDGVASQYPDGNVSVETVEKIKLSYTFSGTVTVTGVKTAVATQNSVSEDKVEVTLAADGRRLNSPRRLLTSVDVTITASGDGAVQSLGESAAQPLTVGGMSGTAGAISVEVEFITTVTQAAAIETPSVSNTVAFFAALNVNVTVELSAIVVEWSVMACSDDSMTCLSGHSKRTDAETRGCSSSVCVTATDDAACCMTTAGSGIAPGSSNAETFSQPAATLFVLMSTILVNRVF